jgi:ribosome-associated protein
MTRELVIELARLLDQKMAKDISVLYIEKLTTIASYFIILTAQSDRQMGALKDTIEEFMFKNGIEEKNTEGNAHSSWLLLDYGDAAIHIFTNESREFYDLDHIWKDAEKIDF